MVAEEISKQFAIQFEQAFAVVVYEVRGKLLEQVERLDLLGVVHQPLVEAFLGEDSGDGIAPAGRIGEPLEMGEGVFYLLGPVRAGGPARLFQVGEVLGVQETEQRVAVHLFRFVVLFGQLEHHFFQARLHLWRQFEPQAGDGQGFDTGYLPFGNGLLYGVEQHIGLHEVAFHKPAGFFRLAGSFQCTEFDEHQGGDGAIFFPVLFGVML